MRKELSIQGVYIQSMYSDFFNSRFLINRKYQRKLVWTIEEKRNFIDTIINNLPVPLFLLAEVKFEDKQFLEVIDGMQRLDAIFSFIEQKYKLKDGFFDLSVMADTFAQTKDGRLKQQYPMLNADTSKIIANYLLPVSKSLQLSSEEIEETFKRINSNGKHLSKQELRQAGATGEFPELIRRISCSIRGDYSADNLTLNQMSKISLTNRKLEFYGIDTRNIFWIVNNILSFENIRDSKDEELIANIIASMILIDKRNYTSKNLDSYYGFDSNPLAPTPSEKGEIESAINRIGIDIIIKQFDTVFGVIEEIFNDHPFREWIYSNPKGFDNQRAFHVIFMALFKLLIKGNMKLKDVNTIRTKTKNIGDKYLTNRIIDALFDASELDTSVSSISGIIENCFVEKVIEDPAYDDWTAEFSKILMQSSTEQNMYDFKIGVHDIQNGHYNKDLVEKIVATLAAINNLGKDKKGYVIIGVADKEGDAKKYEEMYNAKSHLFQEFYITGVEKEAEKYCQNMDKLMHKIKETIKTTKATPDEYINHILINIKTRKFFSKEIIVLTTSFNKPVWFEGELLERHGSSISKVDKGLYHTIYERFS